MAGVVDATARGSRPTRWETVMGADHCPTCGQRTENAPGACPPEPPVGTWVRDRFGSLSVRQKGGGWGAPGIMPFGVWEAMWAARGPLVECGPYGADPAAALPIGGEDG